MEENYEDWRLRFATERLVVLYYLGLIANPVFPVVAYNITSLWSAPPARLVIQSAIRI